MQAQTAKGIRIQSGTGSIIAAILLVFLGAGRSVQAATSLNLLGDPGFDVNPLQGFSTVPSNFAAQQRSWGSEVGTIVSGMSSDDVTPSSAPSMLSMLNADGGITTQTTQVIDVSAYAASINTGDATFDMQALFTTGTGYSGAEVFVGCGMYFWILRICFPESRSMRQVRSPFGNLRCMRNYPSLDMECLPYIHAGLLDGNLTI